MPVGGVVSFILAYLSVAAVYSLLSISMNIEYGWAGIPNFGKAAFIAAGGAAAAIVAAQLGPPLLLGVKGVVPGGLGFFAKYNALLNAYAAHPAATWGVLVLSCIIGGVIAMILGVLFTFPAVRLREDYLAIALLMAAQLVWIVLRVDKQIMGGTFSMVLPSPDFTPVANLLHVPDTVVKVLFLWGLVAVFLYYSEKLMNSPFGRKLRAVRDDEIAAEALGKNVPVSRLQAMMIGSFLAGVAGAIYVLVHLASVNPDYFLPDITFMILAMVLVGGVGNNWGAIAGAMLLALMDRVGYIIGSRLATEYGMLWGGYLYYIVYGLAIIIAIAFRPQGLVPEKPVKTPAWRVYIEETGETPRFLKPIWARLRSLRARRKSKKEG